MADHQLAAEAVETPRAGGYEFGPFRIQLASYQLLRNGEEIDLPSKAFDTLLHLLRWRNRVVTKEELLGAVWRNAAVTDDSLIQAISGIRRALGDDATKPTYVATISRRGYRFIAPVTEWPEANGSVGSPVVPAASAPAQADETSRVEPQPTPLNRRWGAIVWPAVALIALAAGWLIGERAGVARATSNGPRLLRFTQAAPAGSTLSSGGALSPDGRSLAFAAEDEKSGRAQLWIRTLDAPQSRSFDGTDGAARPFWSPDSQFIGFFANGRLKTLHVPDGSVTDLAGVGPRSTGGTWNSQGQILFSTWFAGISAVSASGGAATKITELESSESAHAWPHFLPDGDHFLYYVYAGGGRGGTYIGSVKERKGARLLDTDAGAVYAPPGLLIFTRNGILTAQPFDAARRAVSGEPFSVVTGSVTNPSMTNGTMLSASADGLLSFGGATGESRLTWFDRGGQRLGDVAPQLELHNPALTRGGKQVIGNTYPPSQNGVWLVDLDRGATSRLAADGSIAVASPDGQRVAFTATRQRNESGIFTIPLLGDTVANGDALLQSADRKSLTDWSRDGRYVVYQSFSATTGQDLWFAPANREAPPAPLLNTAANEIQGTVSPDGRWLAYSSDESGRWEVYAKSFPAGSVKVTISTDGGAEPQWRADGRELFYIAEDHRLMAVPITSGGLLEAGRPLPLFRPMIFGEALTYRTHYAVTADGSRFLVDVLQEQALEPINILFNWAGRSR